jgi:hypothetical protein
MRIAAFTLFTGMVPAYTTLFARSVDLPQDGRGLQRARFHLAYESAIASPSKIQT